MEELEEFIRAAATLKSARQICDSDELKAAQEAIERHIKEHVDTLIDTPDFI